MVGVQIINKNCVSIHVGNGVFLQSYQKIVVFDDNNTDKVYLSENYNYSITTVRHVTKFLCTDSKKLKKRIKDGKYQVISQKEMDNIFNIKGGIITMTKTISEQVKELTKQELIDYVTDITKESIEDILLELEPDDKDLSEHLNKIQEIVHEKIDDSEYVIYTAFHYPIYEMFQNDTDIDVEYLYNEFAHNTTDIDKLLQTYTYSALMAIYYDIIDDIIEKYNNIPE